ncbi:ABC transporter substrate-binding protein [Kordiimonas sp. SCSIO 12603]|uniref:ABC transporter substrate-binding protein n=1 Tax=Kordiimonas sp. SCSIO 12603 TaxID=2829596 RepID=UPI002106606D|nr:ABC transporter substrate-binding protein [Kordiimonas sp. SCSIO 12603]UTW59694.1 ABC transporter substrate-binding protein [Kordiimonas sp. SCSIO 12603]
MTKVFQRYLRVSALFFACCLTAACEQSEPNQPLRVSSSNWPGYEPLYIAEALNFYSGKDIHLIETPASMVLMQSLQAGTVDAAAISLSRALTFIQQGQDISIILVLDWSNGADQILARPPIKSIEDITGANVAAEANTVNMFLLLRALENHGMTLDDINFAPMENEVLASSYAAGEIDVASAFGPAINDMAQIGARKIFDSSQIPGEILDVLIVRTQYLEQNPSKVTKLVQGWLKAVEYISNQETGSDLPAGLLKPEDFQAVKNQVKLAGIAENTTFLGDDARRLKDTIEKRLMTFQAISDRMQFSSMPKINTKPFEDAKALETEN